MHSFIRQKTIHCGKNYREIDIYQYTATQKKTARGKRSKKKKVSPPKQKNLNEKNARRFFKQKLKTNFKEGDYHVVLTYQKKNLPKSEEEAERNMKNFLARLSRLRKKNGLPPLKYMYVTESPRMHHHLVTNGEGLTAVEICDLWRTPKKRGQKKGTMIGIANADYLWELDGGLDPLGEYLMKNPKGKKRWHSSKNLINPEYRTNDEKFSRHKIARLANEPFDREFWEREYPGWTITNEMYGYESVYNELTGWSIYLKLRRKDTS